MHPAADKSNKKFAKSMLFLNARPADHLTCMINHIYLRNDFHFSEVYQSVNYIGLRAN